MSRKPYPTDLTDAQWEAREPLLSKPRSGTRRGGRPADLREVCNAVFYQLQGGPVLLVTTADAQDRDAGCWLLDWVRGKLPRVREVVADAGFTRRFAEWVRRHCRWRVTTTHNAPKGFTIHARRWVVERTFAWLVRYRRLGKDHEFLTETSEAMIYAAMTHRMLRSLHPAE